MSLIHEEVKYEVLYSEKEKNYIREANSRLNDRYMKKAPDKHPDWGVKIGSGYVYAMTEDPNEPDHTYDRFEDGVDIHLDCTIKICEVLNEYWNKKEPWWMKW